MNIIFLSNTGTHHALIAANIFLGRLDKPDFRYINGFCDTFQDKSGFPIYIGEDRDGNRVYTLGVGRDVLMAKKSLEDLRYLLGFTEKDLVVEPVFVNGQNIIMLFSHWPKLLGGVQLNVFSSTYLIQRQFETLQRVADELRGRLEKMH